MVESANKLVVEARLKGAGMHWKRENVDPMLALRNIVCSDRWDHEWPKIVLRLRQQAAQRKKSRRCQQFQEIQPISTPPLTTASLSNTKPKASPKPVEKSPRPNSSKSRNPAANHPWRRSPIGRACYQPSASSKK